MRYLRYEVSVYGQHLGYVFAGDLFEATRIASQRFGNRKILVKRAPVLSEGKQRIKHVR